MKFETSFSMAWLKIVVLPIQFGNGFGFGGFGLDWTGLDVTGTFCC